MQTAVHSSPRQPATKAIAQIVTALDMLEGDGFEVKQTIPHQGLKQIDPILLIHEIGPKLVAPGEAKGASPHPHRGFETVSYILEGELEHEDSAGNSGRLFAGDVQWMTAGKGVIHSEMPSRNLQTRGGRMHAFQIWVNLPQAHKLIAPRYQDTPGATLPSSDDAGCHVKVIAGSYHEHRSPVQPTVPVEFYDVTLRSGASFNQFVADGYNALIYVFEGEAFAADTQQPVQSGQMAVFDASHPGSVNVQAGTATTRFLFIAGKKLDEPVARYGPFVMNTAAELEQAYSDLRSNRFLD